MRKTLLLLLGATLVCAAEVRPRIRAVTAFIDFDRTNYAARVDETGKFLATAKDALNKAGFEGANGRITTSPFPTWTKGLSHDDAIALVRSVHDATAKFHTAFNIGPALINDTDDPANARLLTDIMVAVNGVAANVIVADEKGIHWKSLREAAKVIKDLSTRSPHGDANFNFAAIAMMKPFGPYYPGSYHLGKGRSFAIAMEGANVVADVFKRHRDPVAAERELSAAFAKYTKEAEAVAMKVAAQTGWSYEGIDATPAPGADDSIGAAIEAFTGGPIGSSATMLASGIITRSVQSTSVKRTGYSGLMVPVMEDKVLASRWADGTYSLDSILAYSAVCAGGVDTVPLPGDVTVDQIGRIISDVAWLAWKWNKPLAARLLPAPGKKVGERTEFSGAMLTNTIIQPLPGTKRY